MGRKALGKSFRKVNLAHTGDFGHKNEKIRSWVLNNGGTFSQNLSNDITHLVCSKKAWKAYPDIVREARRKRIKVVSLDWLEDSLLSSNKRPKKEAPYEWDNLSQNLREKEQALEAGKAAALQDAAVKFDKQCLDFESEMQTTGYHPYSDPDGFCYTILLVRTFLLENRLEKLSLKVRHPLHPKPASQHHAQHPCPAPMYLFPISAGLSVYPAVRIEQNKPSHQPLRVPIPRPWAQSIQLFQSDACPHTYACYVKYTRQGASGSEVLAMPGSSWTVSFDAFRKFFKTKTRYEWEDRLNGMNPPRNEGLSDEPFRYLAPTGLWQPRGMLKQKTRAEIAHEEAERRKEIAAREDDEVTMVVPTVEDDAGGLDVRARTPDGVQW